MGELSFLTIIVSLAVCSLLVYAAFQYMKVRLSILEQSHKEQAMILQQYIEESSTDIHRLYKMTTSGNGGMVPPNGSIILEYANENVTEKPVAYNEPHIIHLDTALFQNNRSSNLIEISSDSEDTTDTDTDGQSDESSDDSESEHSDDESESDDGHIVDAEQSECDTSITKDEDIVEQVISDTLDFVCNEQVTNTHSSEIKMVTIDLGTIQGPSFEPADVTQQTSSTEMLNDVLSMLYKKAKETPLPDNNDVTNEYTPVPESSAPVVVAGSTSLPLSGMSVTELKFLLKEKFKNHPEKHSEIQKLKKAELIHALQQTQ
jgi:hypothetical protein